MRDQTMEPGVLAQKRDPENAAKPEIPHVQAHVGGWLTIDGTPTELCDPADTRQAVAVLRSVEGTTVAEAAHRAGAACLRWARTSPLARGEILRRAADHLEGSAEAVAVDMTRETGKIISESRAEVARAVDVLRFFAQSGRVDQGRTGPLPLENETAWTIRVPLGVVAVITPWNFPLAIPTWKIAAALLHGNAVVFKPSELAPLSASALVLALLAADLDPDLLALLPGSGSVIGPSLVASPDVTAVTFTGSTSVGRAIAADAAVLGKRAQCEMGGRNALVVMENANLDAALEAVVLAGFGTSGQRCTSASRVILQRGILDEFTEALVQRAQALHVGSGLDETVQVGPLVSARQLDNVQEALSRARSEGAEILCGGEVLLHGAFQYGHFMAPAVVRAAPDAWFTNHETFGPVVSLYEAADFEDAVRLNNAVPYGLSSAIYTDNLEHAFRFVHETDTGMVHVNRPTVGAETHLPFGGAKDSSFGPPELGGAAEFFTKHRTAHVRWGP